MNRGSVTHILVIYQYFGTRQSGWSTRMYEMANLWVKDGAQVTVITSPYYKSDIKAKRFITLQQIDGINLIVINSADSNLQSKWRRVFNALVFSIIATWYTFRIPAQIVIASSGPITVGIPALIASFFSSKVMVFEVRDLWPRGLIEMGLIRNRLAIKLGLLFESWCYKRSKLVIPCSIGMEEDIHSRFPNIQTLTIPNASDLFFFDDDIGIDGLPEWAINPDHVLLLYFGSLGVMDACEDIIEGFEKVNDKSRIQIAIIGDGSEKSKLIEKTAIKGLDQHIHFIPLMPKVQLRNWLKVAKATFVVFKSFPVLATCSPNKLFDSFAAGIPVIQNTNGWMKELIDEFKCGLNVQSQNSDEMASAISSLASMDFANWVAMSHSARSLALHRFNRIDLAATYLKRLKLLTKNYCINN